MLGSIQLLVKGDKFVGIEEQSWEKFSKVSEIKAYN
jgi:hypothetical protein